MRKLLKVLHYVKGYWGLASLNITFNILSVIFGLFSIATIIPFLNLLFESNELVYNQILSNGQPEFALKKEVLMDYGNYFLAKIIVEYGKVDTLVLICVFVGLMFLLKNVCRYLALFFMAPVRNGIVRDFRDSIYKKILSLPIAYYSDERKGDIMSRITTDVQEIEWSVLTGLEMIFRDPATILLSLIILIYFSPILTLIVFLLLPLTALLIGVIGKSLKRSSSQAKEKLGNIFSIMEETLSNLRIIKGFNAEKFMTDKFVVENNAYTSQMVKTYRRVDMSSPMSEFIGAVIMMVLMYLGGRLVLGSGSLEPGEFIFYLLTFFQIIPPAKAITSAYYNVERGSASIERIEKILNAEVTIYEHPNAKGMQTFEKEIEYNHVSFAYKKGDNGWVLKDINLKISKGKTIALVGQSGSGKTTLADMLPRFYDTDEGSITIDGVPIKDLKIQDLRSLLGIVTQESILFNDTVFNNIAFGMKDVKKEDVIRAAQIANAHEFIVQMENGYESNIGDRGNKLSGGQRQRISIARAVLKNPPILILDEATSALDTESEKLVQDALDKLMKNRTSIIIAHRLSTIQHADEIIVLQRGEIIERGNHQDLLSKNGTYRKLYDLQAFS